MKQFSIRDLLFLVLIVALMLGWWLDKRPTPARFQMSTTSNRAYLFDNATGELWSQRIREDGELTGDGRMHRVQLAE
jgi:hypothetical protein